MILSLVKKEQFQKEEFSPKIKITAGSMIVLLLAHLIFGSDYRYKGVLYGKDVYKRQRLGCPAASAPAGL